MFYPYYWNSNRSWNLIILNGRSFPNHIIFLPSGRSSNANNNNADIFLILCHLTVRVLT